MTQPFKKTVFIGSQPEWYRGNETHPAKVFCKIEVKEKEKSGLCLSISGVIGPLSNGDAIGSCGQIYDSIDIKTFAPGWNKTKLQKFLSIWRDHHLNDMNAATPEMKKAGWCELASKEIFKFSYIQTNEASKRRKELQANATQAALDGKTLELSEDDKRLLLSDTSKDIYAYDLPETPEFMEPWTDYQSKKHKIERKTLGWVNMQEHPDGLLGRELDGKKYGHAWYFHEVPADVLQWLFELPETETKPAWI
jgi:hypothetical protein